LTTINGKDVKEVIAYFDSVEIPKNMRQGGMTVEKNGDKKATELVTSVHVSGILQTCLPLPIILQKTMCKTGSLESRMHNAIQLPKILPRFCAFNIDQEQPEIIALPCGWVNKVHPSDDIVLTAGLPLPGLFVPNKEMGKVKIRTLLCTWERLIGNKPLCESGLFDGITVHNLIQVIIIIEIDGLLIWKVDRQTIDGRIFLMHAKFSNVPKSL